MSKIAWADTEISTLREVFPTRRWPVVMAALPRRNRSSILQQARAQGVRRETSKRAQWTVFEESILRRLWPVADQDELCAALPARAWESIGRKASAMGIRRRMPGARKNKRAIQPIIVALRIERERQHLTRPQLGKLSGYHPQQLHTWEMGKASPIFAKLVDWVSALGMELVIRPRVERVFSERPSEPSRARLMAGR